MLKREQFNFFHEIRVRYSEIDLQGIVFNAHYLTYFDTALVEYMRHIKYNYHELVSERGIDFNVVKVTVEFHEPIMFDEVIEIGIAPGRIGNSSLRWALGVFKKGSPEASTSGEVVWVCTKVGTNKSNPLPEDLISLLQCYC